MHRPDWLPETVVVATHNRGKLDEWRQLLGDLGVSVRTPQALGLPEPEETEVDYRGNAALKARAASSRSGLPALADDTGFEAESLAAAPGVATADWVAAHGGYPAALYALIERAGPGTRGRLVCAVAFATGDVVRVAQAHVQGTIRRYPSDAPGIAAVLDPDGPLELLVEGVLAHRRAAFEGLTSR